MTLRNIFPLAIILLLAIGACAELQDNLPSPTASGPVVHPTGWLDTASTNFHGDALRLAGWNLPSCTSCHGATYGGGSSGVSCMKCHTKPSGPENCTVCHGGVNAAPPRDVLGNSARSNRTVGAHQQHVLDGAFAEGILCSECHRVPTTLNSAGHIDSPSPAEVTFASKLANKKTNVPGTDNYSSTLPTLTPTPAFDAATLTCKNVYCHGYFKNGNNNNAPIWNATAPAQAACGSCHGDASKPTNAEKALPKTDTAGGTHPNATMCFACHGDVIDQSGKIISLTKHMNGKLNVLGQEKDF